MRRRLVRKYQNIVVWVSGDYDPKKQTPEEYTEKVAPNLKGWSEFHPSIRNTLRLLVLEVASAIQNAYVRRQVAKIKKPPIAKPALAKWRIIATKMLISRYEWLIVYYRHELRKLGVSLVEPYPDGLIAGLEREFLRRIGWPVNW